MAARVLLHPRGRRPGIELYISGSFLSALGVCDSTNSARIARAYCAWLSLLDDTPLLACGGAKPWSVYRKFREELFGTETADLLRRYSTLSDALLKGCTTEQPRGEFLTEMLKTPIAAEYIAWFRNGDPELMTYILGFLRFLKKTEYVNPELESVAFRGWLDIEEKLSKLSYDAQLLSQLRVLVRWLLPDPDYESMRPKFGNGSVAENGMRGKIAKSIDLAIDAPIGWFLRRMPTGMHMVKEALGLAQPEPLRQVASCKRSPARYKDVAKDITKTRSIAMEPNRNMFSQQGLLSMFVDAFKRGPMSTISDLQDQTRNQEAARVGSAYGQLDTIDLSSASDTVSYELVKGIFPRKWLLPMNQTRSSSIKLPDGTVQSVHKFAPMGSAVCFPTQCVVFAAVCHLAAYEYYRSIGWVISLAEYVTDVSLSTPPGVEELASPIVYGDDIVSDHRVTGRIVELLELLGFVPNRAKSFTGSQLVRESCGKYYYSGHDISFISYRVKYGNGVTKAYDSLVGAINRAYAAGYFRLRSQLIGALRAFVEAECGNGASRYLPFEVAGGIEVYHRSASRLSGSYRVNRDYQRLERKVLRTTSVLSKRSDLPDQTERGTRICYRAEAYDLLMWLHRPPDSDVTERAHSELVAVDSRLRKVWSPIEV